MSIGRNASRAAAAGLEPDDKRLVAAIQGGLPLVPRPYAAIAEAIGMAEADVLARLQRLLSDGIIKRFGVVVRHHELGYRANAMVVWDVPDEKADEIGRCLGRFDFVTLCYRRPRRLPDWPYNLFCMIHGRDRHAVARKVEHLVQDCGLTDVPYEILFSRRRFKQRGALYAKSDRAALRPYRMGRTGEVDI